MRTLRLSLEYRCYPVWIINEKGEILYNDLPDEFKNEANIQKLLQDIQSIYDSLFIDNKIDFSYKGFESEVEETDFISKIYKVTDLIESKGASTYKIDNRLLNE